jgi:hypothetical protein
MPYGMKVTDIKTKKSIFDSSKNHAMIDLNATPKHFDTIVVTGTAFSVNATSQSETVAKIKHNLPYTPIVWAFMYQGGDVVGSGLLVLGTYYRNYYSYVSLGGTVIDQIVMKVDDTHLSFIHFTEAPFPYTSIADVNPVTIKYYIFSRKAFNNPAY